MIIKELLDLIRHVDQDVEIKMYYCQELGSDICVEHVLEQATGKEYVFISNK